MQVFQGADGAFTLYEDEGVNYNYEKGLFANIPLTYNDRDQTLEIGERKGEFPGMLVNRVFIVRYIRKGKPVPPDPSVSSGTRIKYNGARQLIRLK